MQASLTPYRARPVRFLEIWRTGPWTLKVYGIAHQGPTPRPALVEAAKSWTESFLRDRPTAQQHYGVGFLGIHDGRGENQVFLDRWVNENELLHHYVVSAPDSPAQLRACGEDHNSVCVWDLAVQCFERIAWVDCVLANPRGPDLGAYIQRRLNADI